MGRLIEFEGKRAVLSEEEYQILRDRFNPHFATPEQVGDWVRHEKPCICPQDELPSFCFGHCVFSIFGDGRSKGCLVLVYALFSGYHPRFLSLYPCGLGWRKVNTKQARQEMKIIYEALGKLPISDER